MRKRLTKKELKSINERVGWYVYNTAMTGGAIGCGSSVMFEAETRRLFKLIAIFATIYKEEISKFDLSVFEEYKTLVDEENKKEVGG